jgi:hypothetical protein
LARAGRYGITVDGVTTSRRGVLGDHRELTAHHDRQQALPGGMSDQFRGALDCIAVVTGTGPVSWRPDGPLLSLVASCRA